MEGLSEAEEGWAGERDSTEMEYISEMHLLKGGREFIRVVCGQIKGEELMSGEVKQKYDWGQNKQLLWTGLSVPIHRQTGVLIFTLFVMVDYWPLLVFVVVFVAYMNRVV